jgi:hypothetical protein
MGPKFPMGQTVITPAALKALSSAAVMAALDRHSQGDWGEVCEEDWDANDRALREGNRLLSVYRNGHDTKFWIMTEADRSATTVLLPEDY